MARVLGIVAEYNPFHKGHLYHLNKAKEMVKPDYTLAIMSGHFTQRGEPAILDKWARTAMALENGIDLVLELPTLYACQTAEIFAYGAVSTLHYTGLVTHIAFGSEYRDIGLLKNLAQILAKEPPAYGRLLKKYLGEGLSYPHARQKALQEYIDQDHEGSKPEIENLDPVLSGSNSILAIEYLKALEILKSPIEPLIVPRIGSDYNSPDLEGEFSSATAIRREILRKDKAKLPSSALPPPSEKILKEVTNLGRGPISLASFGDMLLCLLRRSHTREIANWMDVGEGLENRIKKLALESATLEEFLSKTKTKRYTGTRLQRILIHGLLNITHDMVHQDRQIVNPPYIRILGFNSGATDLLSLLKSRARLPLITKPANYYRHMEREIDKVFELEALASDLYCLSFPEVCERVGGQEYVNGPIII